MRDLLRALATILKPAAHPLIQLFAVPVILSLGADGKPGGNYFDADLSSQNLWVTVPETPHEARVKAEVRVTWIVAFLTLTGSLYLLVRTMTKGVAHCR